MLLFFISITIAFYVGIWFQGEKNTSAAYIELNKREEKIKTKFAETNEKLNQILAIEKNISDISVELNKREEELNTKSNEIDQKLHHIQESQRKLNQEKFDFEKSIKIQQIQLQKNKLNYEEFIKRRSKEFEEFIKQLREKIIIAKQTEQVIERKIKGYGDEYLIPTTQLIDEIADEYSSREAASILKTFRQTMRIMIKKGTATIGESTTVSKILLDFFNTKTEELIRRVKHDNYGKLKQELTDLYILSEYHAKQANFAARINPEYHAVRQNELKWASILHAIKMEEREEQQAIREIAREEERARKEYEKAIKEAAREEALIQAAMDKAKAAIAVATAEQKAKYEAELSELTAKLHEAETKNQRALSMAQQTRAGYVYLISNMGSFGEGVMKIGMTRRLEPMERVKELGDASVPFLFDVHAMIYSEDAPALEKQLHRAFNYARVNKVNHRKEFFRITASELKQKLAELGIDAHFTLIAEAAEYRETLKIESMNQDKKDILLEKLLKHEY